MSERSSRKMRVFISPSRAALAITAPTAAQRFEDGDLVLNQRGIGCGNRRVDRDQRLFRGEQLEGA
jgi:hypothetical protein